jgi:hypothetical protein
MAPHSAALHRAGLTVRAIHKAARTFTVKMPKCTLLKDSTPLPKRSSTARTRSYTSSARSSCAGNQSLTSEAFLLQPGPAAAAARATDGAGAQRHRSPSL